MAVLLVTYDLNRETVRPNITTAIREFPWAQLSESSYAIETMMSPKAAYQHFASLLDSNDQLIVITLTSPWWGSAPDDVLDWLKTKIR